MSDDRASSSTKRSTDRHPKPSVMGHQMNFHSIYSHGFARVAACTIVSSVADPTANAAAILDAAKACHEKSVAVAVFPELCLSGYAIEDLLLQDALLDATKRAVATIVEASVGFMTVLVVGAPLRHGLTNLQLRCRDSPRTHSGCRAENLSADLQGIL